MTTRRVDDVDVGVGRLRHPIAGDLDGIVGVGVAVELDLGAFAHLFGLIVRAWPERVGLNHGGTQSFLREPPRHLRGGRGLPRALQAREHDRLFFEREFRRVADERDEFLVDDPQDVVAGGRPTWRLLFEGAGLDRIGELHHQRDVDVGL
ncbi:hypothetical protein HAPAU_07480 [Halalkalicoccus paucihalophilus]|uniref:Uncharacterized protein n=1 Tax=Halalkalicoccus paucihalophilus TaxID=1008153 RepID=A0A151AGV0_9EURY|nr:hypothetical protein HAPAU_07480 [Halalkalicoccus paucihalophilus]